MKTYCKQYFRTKEGFIFFNLHIVGPKQSRYLPCCAQNELNHKHAFWSLEPAHEHSKV